jgi:hypothetical protein
MAVAGCGSKINKANADKVTKGMPENTVIEILGPATEWADAAFPATGGPPIPNMPTKIRIATWKDGDKVMVVTFFDGKASTMAYTEGPKGDPAKSSNPGRDAALNEPPYEQSGTFIAIENQEGPINFPIPYALPPSVEIVGSGSDNGCVLVKEIKATGFMWKGVGKPSFGGSMRWTAKGVKATKLPTGEKE